MTNATIKTPKYSPQISAEWFQLNSYCKSLTIFEIARNGDWCDKLRFTSIDVSNIKITLSYDHHSCVYLPFKNNLVTTFLDYDNTALHLLKDKEILKVYDDYMELEISPIYLIALQYMRVKVEINVPCEVYARYIYCDMDYRRALVQNMYKQPVLYIKTFELTKVDDSCYNRVTLSTKDYCGVINDIYFTNELEKINIYIYNQSRDECIRLEKENNFFKYYWCN